MNEGNQTNQTDQFDQIDDEINLIDLVYPLYRRRRFLIFFCIIVTQIGSLQLYLGDELVDSFEYQLTA